MSRRVAARLLATAACSVGLLAAAVPGASGAAPASSAPSAPVPASVSALPVSAAALYAPQTGQILYSVNLERRVAVASTTKLMTALITLQHVHRLGTVFTQNDWYPAADDSQLGLVPGERMSVHDLLLAMMLPSDDDAAEDLAYNVGQGSVPRFVAMMNAEAKTLGLSHTHYSTPIGLDTPGNYSSAGDLVKLAEYDLAHSAYFARMVALKSAVVRAGGRLETITNRNNLVGRFPWIDGVKTGHTSQAGYVLVTSGHRNGMSLISTVLGTASPHERDATSLALLDYGFGSFIRREPLRAHQVLARPAVQNRSGVDATVIAARGFDEILPRTDRVRLQVQVPRQLAGPMPAQAVVGTVSVVDGRRVLARVPLVLAHGLTAVSGLTLAARFVAQPLTLLVIVAAALGGLFWRGMRRRRRIGPQGGKVEAA